MKTGRVPSRLAIHRADGYLTLMKPALLFCTLCTTLTTLHAQRDSTGSAQLYRSLLQDKTLPAMVADNGKHVVQVNTIYQVNTIRTEQQPFQSFQAAYRTQWRNHGFGLVYEGIPGSEVWSNSVGLQYAYGVRCSQHWLRNTKLCFGAGVHFTKLSMDFSQLMFADQVNPNNGAIGPTGENVITNSVFYRRYEAGILLRSTKLFVGIDGNNLNEPDVGFYQSPWGNLGSTLIINAGIKLVERKWFSLWTVYEQQRIKNNSSLKIGFTIAIRNRYALTCFQTKFDGPHVRLAYTTNRLRVFVQYQHTDNPYVGYFNYGNLSLGVAYAIGKQ